MSARRCCGGGWACTSGGKLGVAGGDLVRRLDVDGGRALDLGGGEQVAALHVVVGIGGVVAVVAALGLWGLVGPAPQHGGDRGLLAALHLQALGLPCVVGVQAVGDGGLLGGVDVVGGGAGAGGGGHSGGAGGDLLRRGERGGQGVDLGGGVGGADGFKNQGVIIAGHGVLPPVVLVLAVDRVDP